MTIMLLGRRIFDLRHEPARQPSMARVLRWSWRNLLRNIGVVPGAVMLQAMLLRGQRHCLQEGPSGFVKGVFVNGPKSPADLQTKKRLSLPALGHSVLV